MTRAVTHESERQQPGIEAKQAGAEDGSSTHDPLEDVSAGPTPQEREQYVRAHDHLMGSRNATAPFGRDPLVRSRVEAMRAQAAADRAAYEAGDGVQGERGGPLDPRLVRRPRRKRKETTNAQQQTQAMATSGWQGRMGSYMSYMFPARCETGCLALSPPPSFRPKPPLRHSSGGACRGRLCSLAPCLYFQEVGVPPGACVGGAQVVGGFMGRTLLQRTHMDAQRFVVWGSSAPRAIPSSIMGRACVPCISGRRESHSYSIPQSSTGSRHSSPRRYSSGTARNSRRRAAPAVCSRGTPVPSGLEFFLRRGFGFRAQLRWSRISSRPWRFRGPSFWDAPGWASHSSTTSRTSGLACSSPRSPCRPSTASWALSCQGPPPRLGTFSLFPPTLQSLLSCWC